MPESFRQPVALRTVVREWGRIGAIGIGGPPAHIALFRRLCVEERGWLSAHEFEDGIAATNLLPGPTSTQLAIYCAWRLRGRLGAIIGGICFILPGLTIISALSALFLSAHPPLWVLGLAAGAGATVPTVALSPNRRHPLALEGHVTHLPDRDRQLLPHIDTTSMVGEPDRIERQLDRLGDAGAAEIVYTPTVPMSPESFDQWHRFLTLRGAKAGAGDAPEPDGGTGSGWVVSALRLCGTRLR